ncbi:MAG: PKD domain-containing protein [Bacteroidota bacterium]|jgi:PKD domain
MKRYIVILFSVFLIVAVSCSKKSDSAGSSTPLVFTNLNASDSTMAVNGLISFSATASGDGLTYHWTASYGSFVGSGASVKWTVCHADNFTVTCEVKDANGNSASKTRIIRVHE